MSVPAQPEDYANLCEALVTLFDVTGQAAHLKTAARLMDELLTQFWNEDSGGFYLRPLPGEGPQLARSRSAADEATMSAYGVATQCRALPHDRSWQRGALDIQPLQDPGQAADSACWGEGIRVSATLSADEAPSGQLDTALGMQLRIQVCSEAICLAPETVTFRL